MRFVDRLAGEALPSPPIPPGGALRAAEPTKQRPRAMYDLDAIVLAQSARPNPRALRDLIDGIRRSDVDIARRDALVRLAAWAICCADEIDQRITRRRTSAR